jgi:hypothetical protein
MAVALLLHPVLEDHGDAEDEDEVDTDDTESGGKDLVKIPVRERREFANASTLLRRNEGIQASAVLHKWRCGRVCVAAAVELLFVSI